MEKLETLSTSELKALKSKIEKELINREQRCTCIWSIKEETPKPTIKDWEGETYIS